MNKVYLVNENPSRRLQCGNCGCGKFYYITDANTEFNLVACDCCDKVFTVCPHCNMPYGIDYQMMTDNQYFLRCPQCSINFTVDTRNVNQYLDLWTKEPATPVYPNGDPTVKYDEIQAVSMCDLTETLDMAPVGEITMKNEPNIVPTDDTPKRTRKKKTTVEE
jgi:hypothetical protein